MRIKQNSIKHQLQNYKICKKLSLQKKNIIKHSEKKKIKHNQKVTNNVSKYKYYAYKLHDLKISTNDVCIDYTKRYEDLFERAGKRDSKRKSKKTARDH